MHPDERREPAEPEGGIDRDARREFERIVGARFPAWEDDRLAPPIDMDLIRSVVRRESTLAVARRVWELELRFRSWATVYGDVMVEEFRAGRERGQINRLDDGTDGESPSRPADKAS